MACIDAMHSIVFSEKKEDKDKRKRYFDMIPSLNKLYKEYWNDLQANPFNCPTNTENEIMQLNNKYSVSAQDVETDYEALYRKELTRQDSLNDILQDLKKCKKELEGIIGTDESKLKKKIDSKKEELETRKAELAKLKGSSDYNNFERLLQKQRQLENQIKSLSIDTKNIITDIATIENQINELDRNVNELELIKNDVSEQIIDENKSILNKSFSELTIEELEDIKTRCNRYTIDQNINAFIAEIEIVLQNKRIYDNAIEIVNSKYNKGDLFRIKQSLANITRVNSVQRNEIIKVKKILSHFGPGMATFKEFIEKLNRNREGVTSYSKDDLKDDIERILSKENLQERIDTEIKGVPYLEKTYNEYIKIINANPMDHPEIETEILKYSN